MSIAQQTCKPCRPGTPPVSETRAQELLAEIPGWSVAGASLVRIFTFKNYYETVSFVNAAAWVAHREDHHPEITFGYKTCRVAFSTHSIGGLSDSEQHLSLCGRLLHLP